MANKKVSADIVRTGIGGITIQGDMLYKGASDLERLPKGTAAQTLKMNSGATAPEWTTVTVSEAGLKLIQETSITAVSYIDMTGFDDSKYSGYKLMIENMRPGTNETYLHLRTSSDGGTSFNSNAGYPDGYRYNGKEFSQGNAEADVHNNTGATFIRLSVLLLRADGNGGFNGTYDILGTPSTGSTSISGLTTYSPSVGGVHTQIIGGLVIPLTLTNAIRLSLGSGDFQAQGVVRLFGYTTTV